VQAGAEDGSVQVPSQVHREPTVVVDQADAVWYAPSRAPRVERRVPHGCGTAVTREVVGVQQPSRVGQDRLAEPDPGQVGQAVGDTEAEALVHRASGGAQFGEEPGERRCVGAGFEGVQDPGFDALPEPSLSSNS